MKNRKICLGSNILVFISRQCLHLSLQSTCKYFAGLNAMPTFELLKPTGKTLKKEST
jgi:hypothetical protein